MSNLSTAPATLWCLRVPRLRSHRATSAGEDAPRGGNRGCRGRGDERMTPLALSATAVVTPTLRLAEGAPPERSTTSTAHRIATTR